tara:strand:+ start:707 stop:1894 length:1188 start_codon:yes stop_codon:yes gene_type:complete
VNIVILTFSGIPTLDYCLPFIKNLKREKNINEVYLLSNALNSKSIFTENDDTINTISLMDIKNVDLSTYSIFQRIKSLFIFSLRDLHRSNIFIKFIKKLERLIIKKSNLTVRALKKINPDIIFFDHRPPKSIENYSKIFEYLLKNNISIYLTPHAPHYLETGEHLSTMLDHESLGKITYLEPFKQSGLPKEIINLYKDVQYTSYPGLEKNWLSNFNETCKYKDSLVVMLRPFHTDFSKWSKDEKVVLRQQEITEIIECVNLIAKKNDYKNIILKPHPKNYSHDLEKYVIPFLDHKNIILYKDSIYNLISISNDFISTYSTTALISIANGSKTFIVNSEIFSRIFEDWDTLKNLYSNFSGFTTSKDIADIEIDPVQDQEHLRKFFDSTKYNYLNFL